LRVTRSNDTKRVELKVRSNAGSGFMLQIEVEVGRFCQAFVRQYASSQCSRLTR
jgi:hypothetical protein